jgi:hypothetical protein
MNETLTTVETVPPPSPETTELERRVLAHERILQSLIAYMSRTEPRFIDHLKRRFVEPMNMKLREHDHRDADDYAEEFIRAVMLLGETRAPKASAEREEIKPMARMNKDETTSHPYRPTAEADRVQTRERSGIWEVRVDGVFRGDYHQKAHALAAAALARLSLR